MKKYWIIFLSSLTLLTSAFVFQRSKKEADVQQIPLASLVNDSENIKIAPDGRAKKPRVFRKLYTKDFIDGSNGFLFDEAIELMSCGCSMWEYVLNFDLFNVFEIVMTYCLIIVITVI